MLERVRVERVVGTDHRGAAGCAAEPESPAIGRFVPRQPAAGHTSRAHDRQHGQGTTAPTRTAPRQPRGAARRGCRRPCSASTTCSTAPGSCCWATLAATKPAGGPPFRVEIVGERSGPLQLASGVPIDVQRAIDELEATDIVIVPSVVLHADGWEKGRYPRLVAWLRAMHARGAVLCSACSGIFLLAETGAVRRQGRHRALRLRARVHGHVSRSADAPRARARDLGAARGAGQLGRVDDLARPGAVPHRALRRRDRRAGGGAHVRAAVAPGRAHAVHRVRGQARPRRRRDRGRAGVAARATSRWPIRSRR